MLKKEYASLNELLTKHLNTKETNKTMNLIKEMKEAKRKGYFTRKEMFNIAHWKSPRKAYLCWLNSKRKTRQISKSVFSITDDKQRMELLRKLWGVGVPVASAILTIIYPKKYGVIDFRVWQVLNLYKLVDEKPSGKSLSVNNWLLYVNILRDFAKKHKVKARDIDRTLFDYHKELEEK